MPARRVRLVVSDIDGTLVRKDKTLPVENVAAVRELVSAGIAVSLISARPPAGMLPIIAALGLDGPFGAFNGGTIFGGADGDHGAPARIERALAERLDAAFAATGVVRWVFAEGHWLTSAMDDPHNARERLSSGLEPMPLATLPPTAPDKLVAVCDDPALLSRVEAEARALAGDRATVVRSQAYYLDVTAPAANKGDGIERLAAAFGVPLGEVAVLGDQANDVAMFRRAGLAIAMGQADAAVRAEADAVAASNEDCGVADAIRRFILA